MSNKKTAAKKKAPKKVVKVKGKPIKTKAEKLPVKKEFDTKGFQVECVKVAKNFKAEFTVAVRSPFLFTLSDVRSFKAAIDAKNKLFPALKAFGVICDCVDWDMGERTVRVGFRPKN